MHMSQFGPVFPVGHSTTPVSAVIIMFLSSPSSLQAVAAVRTAESKAILKT
jgi:hypothetical protein